LQDGKRRTDDPIAREDPMTTQTVRVVQFGLGPIGQALAKEVLSRGNLELAGAVDRAPRMA